MVNSTFDYIVIGAGSAGCVMANRLSADSDTRVLLLEAGGPDDRREISIPAAAPQLFRTEVDWEFYTVPQAELNGRRIHWPRGRVLGGTSSLNWMIYSRGDRSDYDQWAALGNEGWRYDDVLPYFKRAQHQERGDSTYHGTGGPLNVAEPRDPNLLSSLFVEAAVEVGFPRNDDFNGARQEGAGLFQVTQKNGKRHSTAGAYLTPALQRPNLTALTGVRVTRVLLQAGEVTGVEYVRDGATVQAQVTKEVILCAGAVNSPQLLMLSGIGPADHLREHGIAVHADLAGVGQNLQDHLSISPVAYECTATPTLNGAGRLRDVANYLLFKRGPLTSTVAEAAAFVKSDPDLPRPDLEVAFLPIYVDESRAGNELEQHGFTIASILLYPESRGQITLRSPDPMVDPVIDPRYLTAEKDREMVVEGLKLARKIGRASPFDDYRGAEIAPGEEVQTAAEIAAYNRSAARTAWHPVGTCKMGRDEMAVVDDRLRVRGVKGLRVVDASIMPTIIGGHTNAPVIMIAEKAADLVKGDG